MNLKFSVLFCVLLIGIRYPNDRISAQTSPVDENLPRLDNPITVQYLKDHLRKEQPRLVLDSDREEILRAKLEADPVIKNMYDAIRQNADQIMELPLLERKLIGIRLLSVSREMLYRINMLGMVYFIEKDKKILDRIDREVRAVCDFSDWNPSHFLDVGEMSLAVSLALDWTAGQLPEKTITTAKKALIEKGIRPSWTEVKGEPLWWVYGDNNWNQVCHGGMIAASVTVAEDEPELAARTIARALDGLPHALKEYAPDGVYPEGSTYWNYGTVFSVTTTAMLESAFDTDFGHYEFPGFRESAVFRVLMNAPSGMYYNFADCGDRRSKQGDITLAWFASKSGNSSFFEKDRFLMPASEMGKLPRLAGAGLVWMAEYEEKGEEVLSRAWKGEGANPVVVFTGGEGDPNRYYFGGKGGRGTVNHGNMDGGSFVFELDGIRWAVDPGNQDYNTLEQTGFNLWGRCQECERWTLLTKNNFGHNTLTVNDSLHRADGMVTIEDFREEPRPRAVLDMTATLGEEIREARRTFEKDGPRSVIIEDEVTINENTRQITWQMLTTADVEIVKGGVILRQEGQSLRLENLSRPDLMVSVVSLDPPPLVLDRRIEGLKRLEIRVPAWTVEEGKMKLRVRLSGE